jgi:predicted enzyme related to lactoylglutathione lyase
MRISDIGESGGPMRRWQPLSLPLVLTSLLTLQTLCALQLVASSPPLPPLSNVSGSPRLQGKFVWADLVTDDVPAARKFYSDLFGWTFQSVGDYIVVANQDHPICGMFQRQQSKERSAQPRWLGYISTKNVQGAQRAVLKLGGRVLEAPQKLPKRGEQAVFTDPEGATFGVIKSSSGDPQDLKPDPGDWVWMQLLSRDAARASEFYRQIGGYEVIQNTESNRLSDFVLVSKGYARATVRTIPSDRTQTKPDWLPYVRVSSATDSTARARQLGGEVLVEPKPEFLQGKVAVVRDPTGAVIGLLELSEQLLRGGH